MWISQVWSIRNSSEIWWSLCSSFEHHQWEDLCFPLVLVCYSRHHHCHSGILFNYLMDILIFILLFRLFTALPPALSQAWGWCSWRPEQGWLRSKARLKDSSRSLAWEIGSSFTNWARTLILSSSESSSHNSMMNCNAKTRSAMIWNSCESLY